MKYKPSLLAHLVLLPVLLSCHALATVVVDFTNGSSSSYHNALAYPVTSGSEYTLQDIQGNTSTIRFKTSGFLMDAGSYPFLPEYNHWDYNMDAFNAYAARLGVDYDDQGSLGYLFDPSTWRQGFVIGNGSGGTPSEFTFSGLSTGHTYSVSFALTYYSGSGPIEFGIKGDAAAVEGNWFNSSGSYGEANMGEAYYVGPSGELTSYEQHIFEFDIMAGQSGEITLAMDTENNYVLHYIAIRETSIPEPSGLGFAALACLSTAFRRKRTALA